MYWSLSSWCTLMTKEVHNQKINCSTYLAMVEEHLLSTIKEKEGYLKDNLCQLKKGSLKLDEYIGKFKFICDSLASIN